MTNTAYKLGNIVRHEYRKSGFYKVIGFEGNNVLVKRCKKQSGWPLSDAQATYKVPMSDSKLSLFDAGEYTQDVNVRGIRASAVTSGEAKTIEELKKYPFLYSSNIVQEFESLIDALSPENLSCDGELSASQVRAKEREIEHKWSLLEQYLGVTVVKA